MLQPHRALANLNAVGIKVVQQHCALATSNDEGPDYYSPIAQWLKPWLRAPIAKLHRALANFKY